MKMLEYVLENLWTSTSYLFHSYIHDIVHGYDLWLIIYIHLAVFEEIFKKPMDSPQVSSSCVKDTTTVQCSQHLVTMFRIHPSPRVGQSQLHTFFGKVPLFWEWHDEAWSLHHHILYSPVTSHPFDIEITVLYWSFKTWIHIQRWILRIHSEHMICDYIWCQVRRVLTAFYQFWIHLGEVCWQFGRHKLPKFPANPPLVHPISPNGLLVVLWTSRIFGRMKPFHRGIRFFQITKINTEQLNTWKLCLFPFPPISSY